VSLSGASVERTVIAAAKFTKINIRRRGTERVRTFSPQGTQRTTGTILAITVFIFCYFLS
jgi:hypothetical protein